MNARARKLPTAVREKGTAKMMAMFGIAALIANTSSAPEAGAAASKAPNRLAQADNTPKYPGAPAQPATVPSMPGEDDTPATSVPSSTPSGAANANGSQPILRGSMPASAAEGSGTAAGDSLRKDFHEHLDSLKRDRHSAPAQAVTGAEGGEPNLQVKKAKSKPPSSTDVDSTGGKKVLLRADDASPVGPSKVNIAPATDEEMSMSRPKLESLISVNEYLNPFSLDASTSAPISLRDALHTAIDSNLDLAISRTITKQRQFAYYSELGKFAPDPTMGFSEFFVKGHIGLPNNAFASITGANNAGFARNNNSTTIKLNHPFEIMHAGVQWYAYRGGSVLFGSLQARNNLRAARHQERASLSDTLMAVTRNYYNLMLSEAVLKIRIDAVRTSEEQLRLNQDRKHAGLATNLDVLQSQTQLSRDRQALVDQQAVRRSAAISLADSLNMTMMQDLLPVDLSVRKVRLVDPKLNIGQLLRIAIDSRPELKQYEELRLAAKKAIMVSAANLHPTVSLSGNAYGIGPPNNVQGLGVFAVNVNWRLRGMGIVDSMEIQQSRWKAREAGLEAQKELQTICSQVRNSYVQILDKERNVEETSNEVRSALEELRLAELRKSSGLGLNLDIITAQRDYTQARVNKAQALIDFNIAQAQLLHDSGVISTEALTSGRLLSETK